MMEQRFDVDGLGQRILRVAVEVHRALGPAFNEGVYENAMVLGLRREGLSVHQQRAVEVFFLEQRVGEGRIDLLVKESVVLELKVGEIHQRKRAAQVRSYLAATGLALGYVLNFSQATMKDGISRVVMTQRLA